MAGSICIYDGSESKFLVDGLHPCTQYIFNLRAYNEAEETAFSDWVTVITEEDGAIDVTLLFFLMFVTSFVTAAHQMV